MIAIEEIEAARVRIAGAAVRTPLVRLPLDGPAEIWCKLETLQPVNSFKIRGAVNCVRSADPAVVRRGLVTASAGNMAQGVAWIARELGLPATIAVPDHAPAAKLDAIARLGGTVVKLPYADWWRAIVDSRVEGVEGLFVHPVADPAVMAGNGTIGLEILEDLPDVDAVVIPYGGGGLSAGIASALRARAPQTRIYTVEPETAAAAVAAARRAGEPTQLEEVPSFVDGAGSRGVLAEMWPQVAPLIDDALVATLEETAAAVRLLAERLRVIAEGAGALATAAALAGGAGGGKRRRDRVGRQHRLRAPSQASSRRATRHERAHRTRPRTSARRCSPGSGGSDYERYLRTDELLALQKTPQDWAHRDELLFQTVHQSSELWLKLGTTEVEEAAALLEHGQVAPAIRLLRRAVLALDYVTTSLAMLEKMSPWEYQQIRVVLGHGSGFDSPGFRAVAAATRHAGRAFAAQVARAGLGLVELYQRGREFEQLYQLAEALTDWDERIWVWRFRHYATVVRHIGEDTKGTQGTPVAVLGKLIAQRQLPELWQARAGLVERFDAGER